jgi:large subunit ribosomal protein L17
VEPLITKSKEDDTHSRRIVFSKLRSKEAVTELFREVSVKIANRPGGYTRILKTGCRLGDNAEMAMIELVDYNENMLVAKEDSKDGAKRRGRRRGGKKNVEDIAVEANVVETKAEETVEEPKAEATDDKNQDKE